MKNRSGSPRRHIRPFRRKLFSFALFTKSAGCLIRELIHFSFMKDLSYEVDSSAEAYYGKNIENLSHLNASPSYSRLYQERFINR
jgi:hypothetical protein